MLSTVLAQFLRHAIVFALTIAVSHMVLTGLFANAADEQPADRPIKDKWAVIIGISDFADKRIPKLKYPAKDAQDFSDFLISKGHFAKDHVLLLKNEQASRVRILDAFGDGWLPRRVMKDDLVVIFISSHGSPADIAGENFVIAHDSDPEHTYATAIRLQDLAAEVTKRSECDRVVVLLDACHSGSAISDQKGLEREHKNFDADAIAGTGQLVITSSSPSEVSWESKRYQNGVFTRKLIESLQAQGDQTTVSQAYTKLKNSVEQEVRFDRIANQRPMMASKWKGHDLALCALPAEPRVVPGDDLTTPVVTPPITPPVTPPITPPKVKTPAPVDLVGNWQGEYTNDLGMRGADSLRIQRDDSGKLTGVWGADIQITLKPIGDKSFELRGQNATREYRGTGTFKDGTLTLDYSANYINASGSARGRSVLTRR